MGYIVDCDYIMFYVGSVLTPFRLVGVAKEDFRIFLNLWVIVYCLPSVVGI